MPLSLNHKLECRGVGNMVETVSVGVRVEENGLRNQINRLEVLRVATCAKSHAFKKYTNEQLENIIEDLKDVLLGLETLDKGANN